MTNWKQFTITKVYFNKDYIRFHFDNYIKYRNGYYKSFAVVHSSPFNSYHVGDCLEIDLDAAIRYSLWDTGSGNNLSGGFCGNTDWIRKVSSASVLFGYNEEDIRRLRNRISELERKVGSLESSSDTQLTLRRRTESNLNIIKKERDGLQSLVKVGERELSKKNSQIDEKDRQIARRDEQIREKEGQLTISREEARRVTELFNNLQIESSNKDNQINQKAEELKQKEKEIIELKAQLGTLSPEEVLSRKIAFGEKELDDIVCSLSLNHQTTMNLCDAYERFELAQREGNRDDKNNARNNIRNIKQELFTFATENNISNDDLHRKIYQNCEELAKLRVELEVLKENQYQARQEVPPYGCNQQ